MKTYFCFDVFLYIFFWFFRSSKKITFATLNEEKSHENSTHTNQAWGQETKQDGFSFDVAGPQSKAARTAQPEPT